MVALNGNRPIPAARVVLSQESPGGNNLGEAQARVRFGAVAPGVAPIASDQSDAQGRFRFEGVPQGVYSVEVSAFGYTQELVRNVAIVAGQAYPLELQLKGTGALSGTVRDAMGKPLEGVSIFASALETQTNNEGVFRFERIRVGSHAVSARQQQSGGTVTKYVAVAEDAESSVAFEFGDFGVLEGTLTRPDGKPIAASVMVLHPKNGSPSASFPIEAGGAFRQEVPPGTYTPSTAHLISEPYVNRGVTIERGKTTRLDIVIRGSHPDLAGTVVDSSGTPVPYASVSAAHLDWSPWQHVDTACDDSGHFEFPGPSFAIYQEVRVRALRSLRRTTTQPRRSPLHPAPPRSARVGPSTWGGSVSERPGGSVSERPKHEVMLKAGETMQLGDLLIPLPATRDAATP